MGPLRPCKENKGHHPFLGEEVGREGAFKTFCRCVAWWAEIMSTASHVQNELNSRWFSGQKQYECIWKSSDCA